MGRPLILGRKLWKGFMDFLRGFPKPPLPDVLVTAMLLGRR